MKKYIVTLVKKEAYEVTAHSQVEAFDKACELCDQDMFAWTDPVEEWVAEEVE